MKQKAFFVTGIGTEVGKTVVAATLVEALAADYWKPVQSGDLDFSDTAKVQQWTTPGLAIFHPERHRLQQPLSPHAAAAIDGVKIELTDFTLPLTSRPLIVEGAGGLMVPLNSRHTMLDLIAHLALPVILVSRHYLGSINHTLLSLAALQQRGIPLAALIFNGPPHPSTEEAIEQLGGVQAWFRMPELPQIDQHHLSEVATVLRSNLIPLFHA